MEKDSGHIYFNDLELHTLELTKFARNSREEVRDVLNKIKTSLDLWMAFLTRHDLLQQGQWPTTIDNRVVQKALGVIETMNMKPKEREIYEGRLKWLRIEANTIKNYESKGFMKRKKHP